MRQPRLARMLLLGAAMLLNRLSVLRRLLPHSANTNRAFAASLALSGVALTLGRSLPPAQAAAPSTIVRLAPTRIDPAIFAQLALEDAGFTWSSRNATAARRFQRRADAHVAVRFDRSPSPERLDALERAGVHFGSNKPALSGAWLANVTEAGARALEGAPDVVRLSSLELVHTPRPEADTALVDARVAAAESARRAVDGTVIDGTGTVIADVDGSIFAFHPAFFRADGGLHAFVDVDGDGALTPGVDGIDGDGDGGVSAPEVLRRLPQVIFNRDTGKSATAAKFAPDREYLFLDVNGNGKRDYGASFTEDTPAYGEPLFVADDADRDGKVATTEKLVQLKTSKIRAVRDGESTFHRGSASDPLVKYEVDAAPEETFDAMGHATLTGGVLVGGTEGSAFRGVAPGADLIIAHDERDIASSIQWSLDQGANVILTETRQARRSPDTVASTCSVQSA